MLVISIVTCAQRQQQTLHFLREQAHYQEISHLASSHQFEPRWHGLVVKRIQQQAIDAYRHYELQFCPNQTVELPTDVWNKNHTKSNERRIIKLASFPGSDVFAL